MDAIPVQLFVCMPRATLKALNADDLQQISAAAAVGWTGDTFKFSIQLFRTSEELFKNLQDLSKHPQRQFLIIVSDDMVHEAAGSFGPTLLAQQIRGLFRFGPSYCGLIALAREAQRRVRDVDSVIKAPPIDCGVLMESVVKVARRLWLKAPPPIRDEGVARGKIEVRPVVNIDHFRQCLNLRFRVYDLLGYLHEDLYHTNSQIEMDFYDPTSLHLAAHEPDTGKVVGTVRLVLPGWSTARLLPVDIEYMSDRFETWCRELANAEETQVFRRILDEGPAAPLPLDSAFIGERLFDHRLASNSCEISRLIVSPEHRGHGISRALFDPIVKAARLHRRTYLLLECAPHHQSLYEKFGFTLCTAENGPQHYERAQDLDQVAIALWMRLAPVSTPDQIGIAPTSGDFGVFPATRTSLSVVAPPRNDFVGAPLARHEVKQNQTVPIPNGIVESFKMKEITISLTSPSLSAETLNRITLDVSNLISRQGIADTELDESPGKEGHKGPILAIGSIILKLFEAANAKPLINILRPLFDNTADLKVVINNSKGNSLEIDGKRLKDDQIKFLIEDVKAFIAAPAYTQM